MLPSVIIGITIGILGIIFIVFLILSFLPEYQWKPNPPMNTELKGKDLNTLTWHPPNSFGLGEFKDYLISIRNINSGEQLKPIETKQTFIQLPSNMATDLWIADIFTRTTTGISDPYVFTIERGVLKRLR